jgi:hypothetical protein
MARRQVLRWPTPWGLLFRLATSEGVHLAQLALAGRCNEAHDWPAEQNKLHNAAARQLWASSLAYREGTPETEHGGSRVNDGDIPSHTSTWQSVHEER